MKYLANFVRKDLFFDFCLPDFISVCELYKIPLKIDPNFSYDIKQDPMIFIDIPDIELNGTAQKIVDRAVLTNYIIKVISSGATYEELINNIDKERFLEESESLDPFKFEVDARGKVMSQEEKLDVMELFDKFNFKAKVSLKKAKRTFVVIDNHHRGIKYFGKLIAGKSDRDPLFYSKYSLNTRKYLGPTSTDNVLGFLMCNYAQIQAHDTVLDPFVGTGSLLIPPSHFQAVTFGCDIDMRVLKGYGVGYTKPIINNDKVTRTSDIFTNFKHYNFKLPQILRADINHACFRLNGFFDSVVCDPPYGHRAFSRKTGMEDDKKEKRQKRLIEKYGSLLQGKSKDLAKQMEKDNQKEIQEEQEEEEESEGSEDLDEENKQFDGSIVYNKDNKLETYNFAPLKQCSVEKIFENLLNIANLSLKKDGPLVCLYPTQFKKGEENVVRHPINFPRHSNFRLVHAVENNYSSRKSRWCLVYKKII